MTSIIPIASSTLLADMTAYVPTVFHDLLPIIAIIVGLPLAFWMISQVVGLAKRSFRTGGGRKS